MMIARLLAFSVIGGVGTFTHAQENRAKTGKRPNILLLLSDDQRSDTIHALGNTAIRTPNLNRLVAEGTTLTHTFVTVPVCTPARAELLTGRNAFRNGVRYFGEKIDTSLTLLPQTLAQAGYTTWFTGKWHNDGRPETHGFQIVRRPFIGGMHGQEMTLKDGDQTVKGFSTELFADAAVDFLQNRVGQQSDKPWFMYVAFTAPHDPRTPPGKYKTMYDPSQMHLPANFMPEHPFDNGEMTIRDEQLEKFPRSMDAVRRHLADYYGMISHLDEQIGRILSALEASGQAENTIIVFVADNGLAIGSHGLMGKMSMYDHSVRVPLIVKAPGVARGARREGMAYLYDLYPTLCEMARVAAPKSLDGNSLVPVLEGKQEKMRKYVFSSYLNVQRMVRNERWKLITYPQSGKMQLFDLSRDPHELTNLLEEWRHRKTRWYTPPDRTEVDRATTDLKAQLVAWQREMNDQPEKIAGN